jgi:hypothetical protein
MEQNKNLLDDLKDCIIDPTEDYRQKLTMWKVNKHGDLVWVKDKFGHNKSYYVIEKERLAEDDWLTHMRGKMDADEFGEFACAYFKACEKAGITQLKVTLCGEFDMAFKFADED